MKNAIIYWFVFLAVQLVAGGIVQRPVGMTLPAVFTTKKPQNAK